MRNEVCPHLSSPDRFCPLAARARFGTPRPVVVYFLGVEYVGKGQKAVGFSRRRNPFYSPFCNKEVML